MTNPSGEAAKLYARALRAEMALAASRVIADVYAAAWRELIETLRPGTPRAQLAIEMQHRVNAQLDAAKKKEEASDDQLW